MNEIEKYCDRELKEMQEYCTYMCNTFAPLHGGSWAHDIHSIALITINRELDERKIRKEGRK